MRYIKLYIKLCNIYCVTSSTKMFYNHQIIFSSFFDYIILRKSYFSRLSGPKLTLSTYIFFRRSIPSNWWKINDFHSNFIFARLNCFQIWNSSILWRILIALGNLRPEGKQSTTAAKSFLSKPTQKAHHHRRN